MRRHTAARSAGAAVSDSIKATGRWRSCWKLPGSAHFDEPLGRIDGSRLISALTYTLRHHGPCGVRRHVQVEPCDVVCFDDIMNARKQLDGEAATKPRHRKLIGRGAVWEKFLPP
jgi:hypothetical protein